MSIVVIRHGETAWSRTGRHTGTTDLPLTARGEAQARGLTELLRSHTFSQIRVSPLLRARSTAELAGLSLDKTVVDDNLREWDYGRYEGLTSTEIHVTHPGWTIFADGAPAGETISDVERRVDEALQSIGTAANADDDVAVVAHGHLLRVFCARWLGQPGLFGQHLDLDAASVSVLAMTHGVPTINRWNQSDDSAHA